MSQTLPLGLEGALENALQPDLAGSFQLSGAHFRRVAPDWRYPRHDHPGFELNYLIEGCQETQVDGRTVVQQAGDILLFAPFDAHASRNAGERPMAYYCLHFDLDEPLLRQLLCLAGSRHYPGEAIATRELAAPLERLVTLARAPDNAALTTRLATMATLFELLAALGRALQVQFDAAPPAPPNTLQTASRLAGWIAQQVETPAAEEPVESMIRRLGYSPAHGQALFSQVYGLSPRQYRSRLKLRRARLLLLDAGLSVRAVGEALGYADPAHFSRQFKRWSGLSPQEYRRLQGRDAA